MTTFPFKEDPEMDPKIRRDAGVENENEDSWLMDLYKQDPYLFIAGCVVLLLACALAVLSNI